MKATFSIISVFSNLPLGLRGNCSAVVLLNSWPDDSALQAIASDFNQPATTFLCPKGDGAFSVRWFAPDAEIGLCGHGSAAALVFLQRTFQLNEASLHYAQGLIRGGLAQNQVHLYLDPIEVIEHKNHLEGLSEALGVPVLDYFTTTNKDIALVQNEKILRTMKPNFSALAKLEPFGYAVTAPGQKVDFVSRTLVPKVQQLEDHATGSSHAALVPFWSERLNQKKLTARQLSPRGGYFRGEMAMNKVKLAGRFEIIASGTLT
jgi:PhzF family phenazine biosynthesis protein